MHRVRLRDYLSRIERLIDENRLPEAASHCHHVLRQYPQHVDSYRLYGRVLLEQQEYTKAIDIFERVASVDPEDLIAHAGLALAYKENLNLPRAVWHMERAFELDPYNRAIRDELAELYAARDGFTRDQIELTRPALARLYFKNSMYREAAAELSSLLRKQPNRPDLKMLLADTLFWGDRRADLIDVCLEIVESMPYSVKANAILAAEWMRNNRPTEANEHWRRVQALTLLTASSVDPNTTLGRASIESDELNFPKEIGVEQLDDISASTPLSDRVDDWSTEVGEPETDKEMPGWLQEIGFDTMEMPAGEFVAEESVGQAEVVDEDLDIDWEEVALSVSEAEAIEETEVPDDASEDLMVADLLAMVDDVETSAHDQTMTDALDALSDLETELDEEASAEMPSRFSPTIPLDFSPEERSEGQLDVDSMIDQPIAPSFEEDSEDWTETLDELSDLAEELEGHRKGMTTILPPLDTVETSEEKDPDWMDDLADGSEVDEVLPDWLHETVGFTDELFEETDEEPIGDYLEDDDQATEFSVATGQEISQDATESLDEDVTSDFELGDMIEEDLNQLQETEDDSDSEIPDWLLSADDVLEELPEEILEGSDDSWLEEIKEDEETASWLEEIEAEPIIPTDEAPSTGGEGLTGFLSRGLGLDSLDDDSDEPENEQALDDHDDEPATSDAENAE